MSAPNKPPGHEDPELGLDGGWDAAAPPDPTATNTVRPPPPGAMTDEANVDTIDIEVDLSAHSEPPPFDAPSSSRRDPRADDSVEPKIDIVAASRAANTAAAMGRAPRARSTTKMKALQLSEALAQASKDDDDSSAR